MFLAVLCTEEIFRMYKTIDDKVNNIKVKIEGDKFRKIGL